METPRSASPRVTPHPVGSIVPSFKLVHEPSSESSDSIYTWDYKRGGVKSKRLHKVRDAAWRSPARRVVMRSRSRSLSSNESPATKTSSTSPANECDAEAKVEAVLAKRISPAAKRRRVSRFGPMLAANTGSPDTNNMQGKYAEIKERKEKENYVRRSRGILKDENTH